MKSILMKSLAVASGADEKISNSFISINDGIIADISATETKSSDETAVFDATYHQVIAGFIDIHNHGAVGVDVNTANAEGLRKISTFLVSQGVTGWVPTFVPDARENYQKVVEAIDEIMRTQDDEAFSPGARILGVHYEGAFANEKMCGALRPQFFKTYENGNEIDELPTLKTPGAIHLTTLAPEIEGGIKLISELTKRNWKVSIGHTNADTQILDQAFAAGATQITHLFNAMTGAHHRDLGVAGWALTRDEMFCEIIADGIHVVPEMLKLAHRAKTSSRLMLVSDSVAPTGLGDGDYELWGEKISVVSGKTRNERGSIAGSVITMLDAFRRYQSLGIAHDEISTMASLAPASALGIEKDFGSLAVGKRADLTALDEQGNVVLTIVGGRIAYQRER